MKDEYLITCLGLSALFLKCFDACHPLARLPDPPSLSLYFNALQLTPASVVQHFMPHAPLVGLVR